MLLQVLWLQSFVFSHVGSLQDPQQKKVAIFAETRLNQQFDYSYQSVGSLVLRSPGNLPARGQCGCVGSVAVKRIVRHKMLRLNEAVLSRVWRLKYS